MKYPSLHHQVAKIKGLENISIWQRHNSFDYTTLKSGTACSKKKIQLNNKKCLKFQQQVNVLKE